jgi:hypothetical protein
MTDNSAIFTFTSVSPAHGGSGKTSARTLLFMIGTASATTGIAVLLTLLLPQVEHHDNGSLRSLWSYVNFGILVALGGLIGLSTTGVGWSLKSTSGVPVLISSLAAILLVYTACAPCLVGGLVPLEGLPAWCEQDCDPRDLLKWLGLQVFVTLLPLWASIMPPFIAFSVSAVLWGSAPPLCAVCSEWLHTVAPFKVFTGTARVRHAWQVLQKHHFRRLMRYEGGDQSDPKDPTLELQLNFCPVCHNGFVSAYITAEKEERQRKWLAYSSSVNADEVNKILKEKASIDERNSANQPPRQQQR